MMNVKLSFSQRLKTLFSGTVKLPKPPIEHVDSPTKTTPVAAQKEAENESTKQTLMLLQKHARLIDFIYENIDHYSDEEIGAGARVVHQGCQKVFKEYITIEPLHTQQEDSIVTLEDGFNAKEIKLTGNISGIPPFKGKLIHRGWKITQINLPQSTDTQSSLIIAPAEVEL
jgi:hypothetical protein